MDMKTQKSNIMSVCVLLTLVFTAYIASALEGKPAFDFSLQTISDETKTMTMNDLRGKVVLLNIWASWCTGCREEMPEFVKVKRKFGDRGFEIVAVNIDNKKKNALLFLKKLEKDTGGLVNFAVLYDADKKLAERYNPPALPVSYLINRNGVIVKIYSASFDASSRSGLEQAIEDLLGDSQ